MTCVLLCRGDWGSGLGDGYGRKGRAGLSWLTFQGCGSREWSLYDRLCPKLAAANASGLQSNIQNKITTAQCSSGVSVFPAPQYIKHLAYLLILPAFLHLHYNCLDQFISFCTIINDKTQTDPMQHTGKLYLCYAKRIMQGRFLLKQSRMLTLLV